MSIVLLVEDNMEEQARAKEVLVAKGFRVVVAGTLKDALRILKQLEGKLSGIVTDLHIPESTAAPYAEAQKVSQPRGLAIVAEATLRAMPVVICSDINHHHARYIQIVVTALERHYPFSRLPFIMDAKDWNRAVQELQTLIQEHEGATK